MVLLTYLMAALRVLSVNLIYEPNVREAGISSPYSAPSEFIRSCNVTLVVQLFLIDVIRWHFSGTFFSGKMNQENPVPSCYWFSLVEPFLWKNEPGKSSSGAPGECGL